jgi:hypothetical protein
MGGRLEITVQNYLNVGGRGTVQRHFVLDLQLFYSKMGKISIIPTHGKQWDQHKNPCMVLQNSNKVDVSVDCKNSYWKDYLLHRCEKALLPTTSLIAMKVDSHHRYHSHHSNASK